jgi:hypothetical protein
MKGAWAELGISETRDSRAIRRAYAGRLKTIDQMNDPASFQRLRQAYEWALRFASQHQEQEQPAFPDVDEIAAHAPVEHPQPQPGENPQAEEARELTPDEILTQSLVDRIREAMESRRYDIAFDTFNTGSAQGILPFGYREYLLDAMMNTIVQDPQLSVGQFDHFMGRAGWREQPASTEQVSRVRQFAMYRQEADGWFVRLQSLAAGDGAIMHSTYTPKYIYRWLPKLIERRNAALFFGGPAIPKLLQLGADDLRRKLIDYRRRENWLKGRIDPQDAARAQRVLDQYDRYGYLLDPIVAFVLGMLWMGWLGHLEIATPLAAAGAGLRGLVVWLRHRRMLAGLKEPA